MRFIEEPNQILRYALMKGLQFSTFASHTGTYMAVTLFHSSALALDGGRPVYIARDIPLTIIVAINCLPQQFHVLFCVKN